MNSTYVPTFLDSGLVDAFLPKFLMGISKVPCLANNLVLRGGAALRYYYLPHTRRTHDLDFSALSELPAGDALTAAVHEAAQHAGILLTEGGNARVYAIEIERSFKPIAMRSFQFVYEWKPGVDMRIGLDISLDETVVRSPKLLDFVIASKAGEPVTKTLVYSLDEIAAEKLRSLLQWTRQLKEKGQRDMPVAGTYFDLHLLFRRYPHHFYFPCLVQLLEEKCRVRDVSFCSPASFFDPELLDVTRKNWGEQLLSVAAFAPLQPDQLLTELESLVKELVFSNAE